MPCVLAIEHNQVVVIDAAWIISLGRAGGSGVGHIEAAAMPNVAVRPARAPAMRSHPCLPGADAKPKLQAPQFLLSAPRDTLCRRSDWRQSITR